MPDVTSPRSSPPRDRRRRYRSDRAEVARQVVDAVRELDVGATAPEAAGVIHTDFQRGFIKAEVVSYDDLVAAGSMADAKSGGQVRIEGKDYVMRDGDVVEFRFSV